MKNKGFTLVELIAIIIVIGLIIGILVPGVTKITEKTKMKSFQVGVQGYIKALSTDNFDRGQTYGAYILDKGILNNIIICQNRGPCQILYNWEIYTLPMENLKQLDFSNNAVNSPAFYKGAFQVKEKKDCFVHLETFPKGFGLVNGFNLGRYWNIGPQVSWYLPAELLQDENEIVVFDVYPIQEPVVSIRDYHILDYMRTEETPLPVGWNVKE